METTDIRPSDEGENRDDRHLVEELESLYHEVARSDHLDAGLGRGVGTLREDLVTEGPNSTGAI